MSETFLEHLTKRGWNPSLDVYVDWAGEVLTFPLWGWNGKLVGYQRYRWKGEKTLSNAALGRYFTWVSDRYKDSGIYGREFVERFDGPIFIVEGAWNAIRVVNCGYSSLAILTATPQQCIIDYIRLLAGNRPLIALCDNDENETGKKMARWTDDWAMTPLPSKDIGDMTDGIAQQFIDEVISQRSRNSTCGTSSNS